MIPNRGFVDLSSGPVGRWCTDGLMTTLLFTLLILCRQIERCFAVCPRLTRVSRGWIIHCIELGQDLLMGNNDVIQQQNYKVRHQCEQQKPKVNQPTTSTSLTFSQPGGSDDSVLFHPSTTFPPTRKLSGPTSIWVIDHIQHDLSTHSISKASFSPRSRLVTHTHH